MANNNPLTTTTQLSVTDAIVEFFKNNNKPASDAEDVIALINLILKAAENELKRDNLQSLWMQYISIDGIPVNQTITVPNNSIRICFGPFQSTDPDAMCKSINIYKVNGLIAVTCSMFPPSCVSLNDLEEIEEIGIYAVEIANY